MRSLRFGPETSPEHSGSRSTRASFAVCRSFLLRHNELVSRAHSGSCFPPFFLDGTLDVDPGAAGGWGPDSYWARVPCIPRSCGSARVTFARPPWSTPERNILARASANGSSVRACFVLHMWNVSETLHPAVVNTHSRSTSSCLRVMDATFASKAWESYVTALVLCVHC